MKLFARVTHQCSLDIIQGAHVGVILPCRKELACLDVDGCGEYPV
ncbi:hypothetical protein HY26_18140 [Hyphomonas sp. GM-8P]|nr:hypothetical protein HY26_18140 [Hyphomonas sp. GM-8P]